MKTTIIRSVCCCITATLMLVSCEKPILDTEDSNDADRQGNVSLTFTASNGDMQMRSVTDDLLAYFQKLNVMVFDAWGEKVFSSVRTQTSVDADFGSLSCQLQEGVYTVVAVGHSSVKSATIKSPQMVQFTASDGEKLTDTFCVCQQIEVDGESPFSQTLAMQRVCAMVQFLMTDEEIPETFVKLTIAYTGGSANFNPSTLEGSTKSSQSESRLRSDIPAYRIFTFPYKAVSGTLKMTVTAYDNDGNTLRQRVFENVPVTRNRITTYQGQFFDGTEGNFTQSTFGFSVNGEWDGEDVHDF